MKSIGQSLARVVNKSAVPYVAARGGVQNLFAPPGPMVAEMTAFGQVGTLFAIVTKCANATSQVEWKLWRKAKSGKKEDRTEVGVHLALQIWNKPNSFYTRQEFVESTQQHMELVGESWYVVSRDPRSSLPLELWPVRPDKMTPVPDADDFLVGYIYTGPNGEQIPLEVDQVIMLRSPNPLDPYRGMGPVQTILPDLNASNMAAQYVANFFANSAEPGGIIEVDKRLSDDEFDEMTTRWREQHQGVSNAHRVAILEQAKWVDRKYSMKDMEFGALRASSSEMIREAFGFPKPMLGTVEDVNRANAEAAEYVFAKWLIVPRLERIKGALNNDFLPLFYPPGAEPDVEFDYETPVPENAELAMAERANKATVAGQYLTMGFDSAAVLEMLDIPQLTMATVEAAAPVDDDSAARLVEAVQKIYLGAGTVITVEEARTILNTMGANLAPGLPEELAKPEPEPAADPFGDPVGPGQATNLAPRRHHHWPVSNAKKLPDSEHPDLTRVQTEWQAALDHLLGQWPDITGAQKQELLQQIDRIVSSGQVTDLLTLTTSTQAATLLIQQAMVALGSSAAGHVVDEAADQDVDITPVPPRAEGLASIAQVVAGQLSAGLVLSAIREALRLWNPAATAADVTKGVAEQLAKLTDAQPKALLGSALTQAQRQGRMNTMLAAPTAAWYASEQLDNNTCGPCAAVNGKWLGNSIIENVNRLYPTGGYVDCEGRDRCRGMVIGVYRPEQVGDR